MFMEPNELPILYRDRHIIAVDKPTGLVVHRSKMARDAVNCLGLLRDQVGFWVYPAHRLDRGTSGVLLFSSTPETASRIGTMFAERSVHKQYLAIVRGWAPENGIIDHPFADDEFEQPTEARTEFERLASVELQHPIGPYSTARYSLIRATPVTGRTHQIRRHMRHISHKVIGDTIYGEGRHNRFFRERFDVHRLLLHAHRLQLPHPLTGTPLTITAPLPAEFARLFEAFAWNGVLPTDRESMSAVGIPAVGAESSSTNP